jgi:hypothetical protein
LITKSLYGLREAMKKVTCSYCAELTIDINSLSRPTEFHKLNKKE